MTGKTGIEMEALTGASAACLTIYDMCKPLGRGMEIVDVRLRTRRAAARACGIAQSVRPLLLRPWPLTVPRPRAHPVAVAPAAPTRAVPAIAFIGYQNSGKTTLVEKVIAELTRRGLRVGSLKHHGHHGFDIDVPAKDTWRHHQAGSKHVGLICATRWAEYADTREEDEMPRASCCLRYQRCRRGDHRGLQDRGLRQHRGRALRVSTVCAARARSTWSTVTRWPLPATRPWRVRPSTPGFATRAININDARAICDLIQDHL